MNEPTPSAAFDRKLTLTQAARAAGVHASTIWRWYFRGVRVPGRQDRVRLQTIVVRGRRYTTDVALEQFLANTVVADTNPQPRPSSRARRLAAARRQARHDRIVEDMQ